MLPILLNIGFIKIYTYGVFLVLAFFWASYFVWKNIQFTAYKEEEIFDGLFISVGGGIVVGRLVHVILHFDAFGLDILRFILINGYPGINFYGALAGAILTLYIFTLPRKINFKELIDYVIPPLFLALGIGKMGSFFAGIDVGTKTAFPLAVKYVNYDGLRHLTAFYESILFLLGSFIAYQLIFKVRRNHMPKGAILTFFWWFTALVTLSMDQLKVAHILLYGQSFNFIVSGIILLTFTLYMVYYFRVVILFFNRHDRHH